MIFKRFNRFNLTFVAILGILTSWVITTVMPKPSIARPKF